MNQIKTYIIKRQAELGLSGNQLAKRAGLGNSWYSHFVSGEQKDLRVDTLLALAKALEVHPYKLLMAYLNYKVFLNKD